MENPVQKAAGEPHSEEILNNDKEEIVLQTSRSLNKGRVYTYHNVMPWLIPEIITKIRGRLTP